MSRSKDFLLGFFVGSALGVGLLVIGLSITIMYLASGPFQEMLGGMNYEGYDDYGYDAPALGILVNDPELSEFEFWSGDDIGGIQSLTPCVDQNGDAAIAVGGMDQMVMFHIATQEVTPLVQSEVAYAQLSVLQTGKEIVPYTAQSWGSPVIAFDSESEPRWAYAMPYGTNTMAPIVVSKEGEYAFAVGGNGKNSLHLVGMDGQPRWKQSDEEIYQIAGWDVDDDGDQEILHNNANWEFVLRETDGTELTRVPLECSMDMFSLVAWPGESRAVYAVCFEHSQLYVLNHTGLVIQQWEVPNADYFDGGLFARFELGQQECLAALLQDYAEEVSMLCLFKPDGTLIYQEVIPHAKAFCAIDAPGGNGQDLLIGGDGIITRYTVAAEAH